MHGRIGEALEEIYAADLTAHSAELAYHHEAGGNLDKAVDYSNRAASAAAKVYAYQQGLNFSETALRLMERRGASATERARQLLQIAVFASAFSNQRAINYLERAVTLFDEAGEAEASAAAHVKIGQLLCTTNTPTTTMNIDRAFIHYAIAEKALKDRPASEAVVGMYRGIAHASWEAARMRESVAAARRAVEIAEQVRREDVWLQAADALAFALNASGRVSESFAIVERIRERMQLSGDPALLQAAAHSAAFHYLFGGDWASAAQWFQRLISMPAVSENDRRTYSQYVTFPLAASGKLSEARAISTRYPLHGGLEVALAYYEGDWEKSLAWLKEFEAHSFSGSIWDQVADTLCSHGDILRTMGDLESAEQFLRRATERCGELVYFEFRARRDLILVYSELQLEDKAASEIERCRKIIADAGDFRSFVGDLHRLEGIFAALSGNIPKADSWFASAIEISRRYSLPFDEAETYHHWGRALNAHGDAIEARAKFDAAIEIYRRVGAGQSWIERIEKAAASSRPSVDSSRAEHNQFRRDGTQWSIVYQGKALRMKDSRGIRYLVHLLQYPQQEFHVLDLANFRRKLDADASVVVLDPMAKAQYSRRLNDLRDEHQDAERCNDLGRVANAQQEIEALTGELSTSLGLGGRSRRFASNAERARVAVSKRIKAAIAQIRDLNPDLGRHLAASVATGNFCSYRPDPRHPIDWQF
jgi:tetratricopeptide (TPR) repeat protein